MSYEDLTVEQKLQRATVFLMRNEKYALFSGVIVCGKRIPDASIPTIATNGVDVMYNPVWANAQTEKDLRGLLLHENMHKAFKQLFIWNSLFKENPKLANIAVDIVVNSLIIDSDPAGEAVTLPAGGVFDKTGEYKGLDAKTIFNMLKKSGCDGDGAGADGDGECTDSHLWEDAESVDATALKDLNNAIRQGVMAEKLRGNVAGTGSRLLGDILAPVVKWEDELLEFVTTTTSGHDMSTWRKPARKWVYQDVYMPSSYSEAIGSLVIAVDTSGSISNAEVTRFLSEITHICNITSPEAVDIIYWGSSVVGHETYTQGGYDDIFSNTNVADGGGTNLDCVPAYISDKNLKPVAVIVLTDGCVGDDWGVWDVPVLFGITSPNIIAPIGKSLAVDLKS
jgi:predicted metal-dependent peptidase